MLQVQAASHMGESSPNIDIALKINSVEQTRALNVLFNSHQAYYIL